MTMPICHYFATILGIRPGGMGFKNVEIAPQSGPLTHAGGCLMHNNGKIEVDFRQKDGTVSGEAAPESP